MKIIDAHLHLFPDTPRYQQMAKDGGNRLDLAFIQREFAENNVVCGIVMGNQKLLPESYRFPDPFRYCISISDFPEDPADRKALARDVEIAEYHLQQPRCVGMKIYAGYRPLYVTDERFEPYYALAARYKKPVAIHMGMTSGPWGGLKYSHPLTLDEAVTRHRDVQFVMCHYGNPFLNEAAAVLEKNPNVAADLSGLLCGIVDLDWYFDRHAGYVQQLRTWLRYLNSDERFMFGTDFPAVHYSNYIEYIRRLFEGEPDSAMEKLFYGNATRIYGIE